MGSLVAMSRVNLFLTASEPTDQIDALGLESETFLKGGLLADKCMEGRSRNLDLGNRNSSSNSGVKSDSKKNAMHPWVIGTLTCCFRTVKCKMSLRPGNKYSTACVRLQKPSVPNYISSQQQER